MASADHFECNICLGTCIEPVVTTCGHLFCWPCIYEWMFSNRAVLTCPVCKNGITEERLIAIYTKTEPRPPLDGDNPYSLLIKDTWMAGQGYQSDLDRTDSNRSSWMMQ